MLAFLKQKGRGATIDATGPLLARTPKNMPTPCKHPQVRIVSRQDDVEFVECLDCGEVFDSDEFQDMEIEEKDGLDPLASRTDDVEAD